MSEASEKLRAIVADYDEHHVPDWFDIAIFRHHDWKAGDLRALLAERTWRPIETAPRDGYALLVWSRADGEDIAVLCDGEWYVAGYGNVKPTHWMPIPPPPESA